MLIIKILITTLIFILILFFFCSIFFLFFSFFFFFFYFFVFFLFFFIFFIFHFVFKSNIVTFKGFIFRYLFTLRFLSSLFSKIYSIFKIWIINLISPSFLISNSLCILLVIVLRQRIYTRASFNIPYFDLSIEWCCYENVFFMNIFKTFNNIIMCSLTPGWFNIFLVKAWRIYGRFIIWFFIFSKWIF